MSLLVEKIWNYCEFDISVLK